MRSKHGNLKRAERKIRQFQGKQWVGYLTPSEALAILDDGATQHQSEMYQREYLQGQKDKGSSAPQWFYFFPSKAQQERWGG
jgi:hypothetical protein